MTAAPYSSGSECFDPSSGSSAPVLTAAINRDSGGTSIESQAIESQAIESQSIEQSSTPVAAKALRQNHSTVKTLAEPSVSSRLVKRGLMALAALGASGLALGLWGGSLNYRWGHVQTDYAVINGRTITVKAPARGTIQAFFARPGASVSEGQLLARINFLDDEVAEAHLTSPEAIELALQAASLELTAQQQALRSLEEQLRSLDTQAAQLASLAEAEVLSQQAIAAQAEVRERQQQQQQQSTQQLAVELARARFNEAKTKAGAAKQSYERHQSLYDQQLITRQAVQEHKAAWDIAQGELDAEATAVAAAQQQLQLTQAALPEASANSQASLAAARLRQQRLGLDLAQQRQKYQQDHQAKLAELPALQLKVEQLQSQQRNQVQSAPQNQVSGDLPAPFSGVVYQTRYDAGEQVERSDTMLTLLDCEDLWVETLITSRKASRIDEAQPVSVYLQDKTAPVAGQVELIEPVSSLSVIQNREQRLLPALPPQMQQQALARVTVRLAPADYAQAANRFCGVGQMASLSFATQRSGPSLPLLNRLASKSSR